MSALALLARLLLLAPPAQPATPWETHCQGCHGPDGRARTRIGESDHVADLTTQPWQKSHGDAQIRKVIAEGSAANPKMKGFAAILTPAEIDGLVRWIRALPVAAGDAGVP